MCAKKLESNETTVFNENHLHPHYVPKNSRRLRHSMSSTYSSSQPSVPIAIHEESKLPRASRSLLAFNDGNQSHSIENDKHKFNASNDSLCFGKCKKPEVKEILDLFRPRCYTDPGPRKTNIPSIHITVPLLTVETKSKNNQKNIKKKRKQSDTERKGEFNVFDSLIKQTLTLTTAPISMNAKMSDERYSQQTSATLNEDVKHHISRSTNSVATLPNGIDEAISNDPSLRSSTPSTLLQGYTEAQSFDCLNELNDSQQTDQQNCNTKNSNESFEIVLRDKPQYQRHRKQLSGGSTSSQNSSFYSSLVNGDNQKQTGLHKKREARTLKQNKSESAIPTNSNLGLDSLSPIPSTHSLRSISPTGSRKSTTGSTSSNNSDITARNEQSAAAAVASTVAVAATGSGSLVPNGTDKEKKRKEISSSRIKKFHRHFSQVPKDEKLINYFSCALVSDILLQGHLYITDNHFAFYSNVFGYVTKVVIPTSSVTKISKEKTAKIIPNAVGVATCDERHVFSSFISREAAYRLMCSVCPPLGAPGIMPKLPTDIEISEEYSIEDDSSCSISGNESPPGNGVVSAVSDANQALLRRTVLSSSEKVRSTDIPLNAKITNLNASNNQHSGVALRVSAPANITSHHSPRHGIATNLTMIIAAGTTASATPTPSTASSSPTTVMATSTVGVNGIGTTSAPVTYHNKSNSIKQSVTNAFAESLKSFTSNTSLRLKFPTELSIVCLGVVLSIVLAVFSIFLLYRLVEIEARAAIYRSPINFNWNSGHDDDIFAEALRWQRQLQDKSAAEAQDILTTNLEQIAKVRRSLETLSTLIRDRSSANEATVQDDISN